MTTKQALEQFPVIIERVFSTGNRNRTWPLQDGLFKESTLEEEVKRVVSLMIEGSDGEDRMLDDAGVGRKGAT
jgi:hypothetical protein